MLSLLTLFAADCNTHFLGLKPWHAYLPKDPSSCDITLNLSKGGEWPKLWLVGLAVLDDLLRIAGMVAVALIIYGGIRYLLSRGEPENTKAALSTIVNALIGLVIAVVAAATVGFIGNRLGG